MMNFFNKIHFPAVRSLKSRNLSWKFLVSICALFPGSIFAGDLDSVIVLVVWLMVDLPMFLLYLIQMILSLYYLRKENISNFIGITNKVLFGAGVLSGVIGLFIHLIFLFDTIKNESMRNALAFSLLVYAVILALSIFSGKKSWELMKKKSAGVPGHPA